MTSPAALPIVFDPALVEEAVLRAVPGHTDERTFRRQRDALYDEPEGDAREQAFRAFHAEWFDRLGLGRPIRTALAELPILGLCCRRCLVTRAANAREEGADLLVASDGDSAERTIALRLGPASLAAPECLTAHLRAELLHVTDMVDPEFGYEPELPDAGGGPIHARLLRERYRTLWNVRVAGLLARRGWSPPGIRESAVREFAATFPMLGADAETAFELFFTAAANRHTDLVAFAIAPRAGGRAMSAVGAPCPLCRFPTYELEPPGLPSELVAAIRSDFPVWRPEDRLCRQCADLYRARALSLTAEASLPGENAVFPA